MLSVKHSFHLGCEIRKDARNVLQSNQGHACYFDYRKKAMANWSYRCYVDGSEPNLWQVWYDDHEAHQGQHDQVFGLLEQQDVWKPPAAKSLKNGLIEVRLGGSPKYRVFGFYEKGNVFAVVAIGSHKQKVYSPKDIMKTAAKRMKEVKKDPLKANVCKRPISPE